MTEVRVGRDAWIVAVPCLLVFRSLGQFALPDGALAVLGRDSATDGAAATRLAAVMRVFAHSLVATGMSLHSAALWFAATAAGIGVAVVFATAARLLPSRGAALRCTLLAASCPAVAFAATSAHLHAAVFLIGAVAAWAAVLWARSGTWGSALLAGAVTGTAHALTPLGALVPLAAAPVYLLAAERPRGAPIGRWLAQAALALGAHLGIAWVALDRFRAGMPRLVDVAAYDAGMLLRLFAREWLRGCLPLSLVAAALLLHSRVRAAALALHLALGAYLLLGFHATASLGNDGACLLPLVPAAALLVMRALGERPVLVVLLLVLGATVAVVKNVVRADWAPFQVFVSGIAELTQGRPFVLVAGTRFDEAVLLREPSVEAIRVRQVGAGLARNAVELVTDLDRRLASGQRVFVSPEAETALLDLVFKARNEHAVAFLVEVGRTFDWQPVHYDGFRAKELVRR